MAEASVWLPSLLQTLAGAIDQAAGHPVITANAATALASEAAKLNTAGVIDAGSVARFQEFMRLGRLYNSVRNYPASEDAFRKALALESGTFVGIHVAEAYLGLNSDDVPLAEGARKEAERQGERIADAMKARPRLGPEQVAELMRRVRERQRAVGYEGN